MGRVRFGQAGYDGCSKSWGARRAEANGRLPMSRAKRAVAAAHGCTQATAAAALELLHDGEWHHTGSHARETAYFDCGDARLGGAIAHILSCGGAAKWRARRESLQASRMRRDRECGAVRAQLVARRREFYVRRHAMQLRAQAAAGDAHAAWLLGDMPRMLEFAQAEDAAR